MDDIYTPFCGVPPVPADLWTRWLFDPALGAGLMVLAGVLVWKAQDRRAAVAGWFLVAFLFVSPLCAASMALFSARVAQHVLLTLIAAPLLAYAMPSRIRRVLGAAVLFAILFWIWHAPLPYAATLRSDAVYWAMHLSLLGSAWLLWSAVLNTAAHRPDLIVLGLALTAAQMTMLSALLVFGRTVWHDWHLFTTQAYGLSPAADQQLAGAVMWVAGGALMLLAVVVLVRMMFQTEGARSYSAPST